MKLETFIEKFDLFADAPDAVAKMRELVLSLAVQGKLVSQDPNDEPATELVRRIRAKSARDVGGRRPDASVASTSEESFPFGIPSNWTWMLATEPTRSISDRGRKIKTAEAADAGRFPVVDQGTQFIRGYCDDEDKVIRVKSPIVVFGDHTRVTKLIDFDFVVGADGVKLLEPIEIEPAYYLLALRWLPLDDRGYGRHFKLLRAARIPVPPLAEQKRIVAKVDELMALCDRLEAHQQERKQKHVALAGASLARFADAPTPANLNFIFHKSYDIAPAYLRKSILTLAVQGKLVPQDPNDEPADTLLERISKQTLAKKGRKQLSEAQHLDVKELFTIPSTWVWTTLGRIGAWGSGSTPARGNDEFYGGGIPWLKSGELTDNRELSGSEETITELALKTCSFRFNQPGDVLLAMYGATIGKAAILAEPAVTNQAVCGCTPADGVLNTYLFDYLLSQREAFHVASEGGAQPNISKVKIVAYPFPLPPFAEQNRIVAKVDELMALVDALETQLATASESAKDLLAAVVAELTSGKERHGAF